MRPRAGLVCKPSSWHGRQAFVLENDLIRLIALTGGGHIAEFRFREGSGPSTLNPLWIPPWKTIEPYLYREKAHAAVYGTPPVGRTISGIVGHNLCLDYFGGPSQEEARQGLSIHGEAPSLRWRKGPSACDQARSRVGAGRSASHSPPAISLADQDASRRIRRLFQRRSDERV